MINNQIDYNKLDPDIIGKAQNGDVIAQLKIGKALLNDGNYTKAINWIRESAQQGNMEAQFRLADLYALGQGTQKSQKDAYYWYTKAALQGYKKALIRIHNLYQEDKRMYCRGQLNSSEKEWADENFKKEHNIRELNEYRRGQHAPILNNAVEYYTGQFKYYRFSTQESVESDLNLAFLYQYGYGTKKNMLLAVDFYKKAAEKGHKDAQYCLAYLYQISAGIKFHYRLALRWYRTSATNGNIAAQNCLAYFYGKGLATELAYEGAVYWYTKAANSGSSSAQLSLGRLYRKGQGVEQNLLEATKWYKLAADQGNNAARNCLNQLHLVEKIPSNSVSQPVAFTLRSKLQKDIVDLHGSVHINKLKTLAQHALMTDGNAMYQVGLKYYKGEDFSQDKDIGFQWIKKAAKAGLKEAELKIAKMYENGDAVDQDYHKSSMWTIKSVKKRNVTALLKLGILYKNGFGVRKDPLEASKWFIISADRGNTHGWVQFGLLRYYGEGVRKDKEEAFEYFYKSALLRNRDSLYQLGWMYENNDFVEIDIYKVLKFYAPTKAVFKKHCPGKAVRFYIAAANLGNKNALYRLAKIYEEGILTNKDLTKAHRYYTVTANTGNPHYQAELALKYINGDFEDDLYIEAFDLFQKAAAKKEPKALSIFQIPIQPNDNINDYSKVIEMFILASTRGVNGIQFNIGYVYEHGIQHKDKILFPKDYTQSKFWYSLASKMGDSRATYRLNVIHEKKESAEKHQDIASSSYFWGFENGDSDIAYSIGLMYLRGEPVSQNLIKAFNLFTAAFNMGHKEAHEKLVISNESETMAMLEAVASSGNVAVQYQFGIYFENKNDSRSIEWFTLAAEGGVNNAYYRLGVLYEEGRITTTDYSKAIVSYEKAIEQDHEDALYRLAQIYRHGIGIDRDYLKAYALYRRAANIGHIGALKVLNLNEKQNTFSREKLNDESQIFPSNIITSTISMLEFSAEQGNIDLQFELGYFYENSEGNQNYSTALKWYTMATATYHTEAMYRLGLLYENGLGVTQDYNKSLQLYNKAKDQGSHYALYRLGILFHHGSGVDEDLTKAVDCYTKAAKLGNHESQYTLGKLYEKGELIQRDLIKALILYTDAYMNGNSDVRSDLYDLYDDQSYEEFFYRRLFRILTRLEKNGSANNNEFQNTNGHIYYTLGRMYLEGKGTTRNGAQALKRFLIAENQYGYSDTKPFTTFIYDKDTDNKKSYIQRMQAYFQIRYTLDSEQQYQIGMIYYEEYQKMKKGIVSILVESKDDDTAYQYFLLAATKNHAKAQNQLGIMYLLGYGVQKNEVMAQKWITKFIEATDPVKHYQQGMKFYQGDGVDKNHEVAIIYIKEAAEKNHSEAQEQLGIMYLRGHGVEQNHKEAMNCFQQLARQRDSDGCYQQGMKFYQGDEVDKNYEVAFIYTKKAAEENHSEAQALLGNMYLQGYGVEKNHREAMKWIQKSIVEMHFHQCHEQGMKFYQGSEVDKNYQIAFLYIKQAAEIYSEAQVQLGVMYLQGQGVEKNHEEAIKWFRRSTILWDARSCYKQGMRFYQGNEVEKDYEIALIYLKKAAENNYKDAQVQLNSIYSKKTHQPKPPSLLEKIVTYFK